MALSDEDFYRKHGPAMRRMAVALVGPSDGEDIMSTAYARVLGARTWASLNDEEKVRYLCRAVTNEARRWGAKRTRQYKRDALLAAQHTVSPEYQVDDTVWNAIANLTTRQRAVVYLTYYEDLKTSQVADRLGISVGSVFQHLNRARRTLEKNLDV